MNPKVLLFIFLLLSPAVLLLFHLAALRLLPLVGVKVPVQKLVIYCIIVLNLPVLFCGVLITGAANTAWTDWVYILLTFDLLAYVYFHFFNMSETARRIRILVGIKEGKIGSVSDIRRFYNYTNTLRVRLQRLRELSQISVTVDRKYRLKGKTLYWAASLVRLFRSFLGYQD